MKHARTTAVNIVHQLRLEAQRGLGVVATIHMPSSDLLHMFDKVVLLSEGHMVYYGRPADVRSYFDRYGLVMGLYSNPADKLITVATNPRKCITTAPEPAHALRYLADECKKHARGEDPAVDCQDIKERVQPRNVVDKMMAVGIAHQIYVLTRRFAVQVYRLPLALMIMAIQGVIQGLMQGDLFREVASQEFVWRDNRHNQKVITNMLGLAFMAASDQFVMMSMAQLLQIPIARPIFQRELGNRMYSASAYYLAHTVAGVVIFMTYPFFTALISYF